MRHLSCHLPCTCRTLHATHSETHAAPQLPRLLRTATHLAPAACLPPPAQDGRIYITSKGCERFKITKVVKDKPVLLAEVEVLGEDNDQSDTTKALAQEVADLFRCGGLRGLCSAA
jgi:hypothetical protein